MKKILIFLATAALFASCGTKEAGYTITGNVAGDDPALASGKAVLQSRDKDIADTVEIVNGKFVFKGQVDAPVRYVNISIPGVEGAAVVYFLENAKYNLDCTLEDFSARKALVKGGIANAVQIGVLEAERAKREELGIDALYAEFRNPETTTERKDEIRSIMNEYSEYCSSVSKKALEDNPHSIYALYQIPNESYDWSADSIKAVIKEYNEDKAFANDPVLKELNDQVAALEATEVGKPAPDFAFDDPDGKPIKLSDIYKQNKVTMIDFWASWCGPCRAANPTITKVYSQYKDKGFGIFGVSFDTSKENWIKAIADDGLVWPNVSDLKGWESAASTLYCIRYIPQNVFVDANGTIIGKRIEPADIEAFVAEKLAK